MPFDFPLREPQDRLRTNRQGPQSRKPRPGAGLPPLSSLPRKRESTNPRLYVRPEPVQRLSKGERTGCPDGSNPVAGIAPFWIAASAAMTNILSIVKSVCDTMPEKAVHDQRPTPSLRRRPQSRKPRPGAGAPQRRPSRRTGALHSQTKRNTFFEVEAERVPPRLRCVGLPLILLRANQQEPATPHHDREIT